MDPDGRWDYSYNAKNDYYWNGKKVATSESRVAGTINTVSINDLTLVISAFQIDNSRKRLASKTSIENFFENAYSGANILASIIEPIIEFTVMGISSAYLDPILAMSDLSTYLAGGDHLENTLDNLWIYLGNIQTEMQQYSNNSDVSCINTVKIEDVFTTYSSDQELSHKYTKSISIQTQIINTRNGKIIKQTEFKSSILYTNREVEYANYPEG